MTTLFNDRFGLHRIYYHESEEAFFFAAEAKAILAVRPDLRRLDPRGMGEFVSCGAYLKPQLFQSIYVLPPNTGFSGSGANTEKVSLPEWEEQAPLEPEATGSFGKSSCETCLGFSGGKRIGMSDWWT
jgi:asparagine synthase (glutamine-hydrolysing)